MSIEELWHLERVTRLESELVSLREENERLRKTMFTAAQMREAALWGFNVGCPYPAATEKYMAHRQIMEAEALRRWPDAPQEQAHGKVKP